MSQKVERLLAAKLVENPPECGIRFRLVVEGCTPELFSTKSSVGKYELEFALLDNKCQLLLIPIQEKGSLVWKKDQFSFSQAMYRLEMGTRIVVNP